MCDFENGFDRFQRDLICRVFGVYLYDEIQLAMIARMDEGY